LPPCLASLDPDQPGAQGVDALDGLSGCFLVRLAGLVDNGHMAGLPESQIPRVDATAEGADAAHIPRFLVEQAGVSKVHFSGSS
jgi:hypothetical protein